MISSLFISLVSPEAGIDSRIYSMRIELKKWQASMFVELFEQVPAFPRKILKSQIFEMTYGEMAIGNGRYADGRVEISPAIRHPRLFIERVLHECGHGIEEWLGQNGYELFSCNLDHVADGFALSILYPEILEEPVLKKVRKIYVESIFLDGFPCIETEKLIETYVHESESLMKVSLIKRGVEVSGWLKRIFDSQSEGFLRRYSPKFAALKKKNR
jgi:hypothetical protein